MQSWRDLVLGGPSFGAINVGFQYSQREVALSALSRWRFSSLRRMWRRPNRLVCGVSTLWENIEGAMILDKENDQHDNHNTWWWQEYLQLYIYLYIEKITEEDSEHHLDFQMLCMLCTVCTSHLQALRPTIKKAILDRIYIWYLNQRWAIAKQSPKYIDMLLNVLFTTGVVATVATRFQLDWLWHALHHRLGILQGAHEFDDVLWVDKVRDQCYFAVDVNVFVGIWSIN